MTRAIYIANISKLSDREKQVLDLVSELPPDSKDCCGWIAERMSLKKKSVDWHMRNLTSKMGVAGVMALIALKCRVEQERVYAVQTYLWRGHNPFKLFDEGLLDKPKGGGSS